MMRHARGSNNNKGMGGEDCFLCALCAVCYVKAREQNLLRLCLCAFARVVQLMYSVTAGS